MVKRKFSLSGPGKIINPIKGPLGVLIVIKLYKLGKELTRDLEVKALWSVTIPQETWPEGRSGLLINE